MKAIVRTSVQHSEATAPHHAMSLSRLVKYIIETFCACLMVHLHLFRIFLAKKMGYIVRSSRDILIRYNSKVCC